ncbi:NAD(P)-dependent oxidoreductase, partial [Mesorhizobium sp. M2D.F.Ca.ET.160.01.1.1]
VVVHLAAYPEEAPWETIFPLNYALTYAVLEAARRAGVRRVVFASSVQAVGFHPIEKTINHTVRPRPSGYYGVSKVMGEALASLYADKHGLSVA